MSGTSAPRDDTGIGDTQSNGSGRSDSDFADDVAPQNDTDLTSDGAPAPKEDGPDDAGGDASGAETDDDRE